MEHPCPPLIRDGLRFISGKPIANSHSGRRQRGLGGGTLQSRPGMKATKWILRAPKEIDVWKIVGLQFY